VEKSTIAKGDFWHLAPEFASEMTGALKITENDHTLIDCLSASKHMLNITLLCISPVNITTNKH